MIRILHMIGNLKIGGSQSMIMNIYRNIDRNEIQFDFIVDRSEHADYAEEIKKLGGKIYVMPQFVGKNFIEVRKSWEDFFKTHKEYKILHSHVRSYASLYIPIAKKYGLITIIHSHSTSNGKGIKALVKNILQIPLRYQADYFFACSEIAGKWLFGKKIVNSQNYFMIKNAIDLEMYKEDADLRKQLRKCLGMDEGILFGHVGRFVEAKNHHFLIDIFKELSLKYEKSKLVLIGDGPLRNQIENQIEDYSLEDRVILLGNRNDVNELLQACDVMLFPSYHEGLPVTIVEAQAASLPCFISENITREVEISELVHYVSINQGTKIWVKSIEGTCLDRKDVKDSIKNAGFDISETVDWLSKFYIEKSDRVKK